VTTRIETFIGGAEGPWRVTRIEAVVGPALDAASHLRVSGVPTADPPAGASWLLRGAASHVRYASRSELTQLAAVQPGLGRPEATMAVLIPIRKSASWWALAQDERRAIFDESSRHAKTGMAFLPAIARQLYHARDLGEPFDFLTWFEFAPEHEGDFDRLLDRLRSSEEWRYVEREVAVRLRRAQLTPSRAPVTP
jgi:hypothetical protein